MTDGKTANKIQDPKKWLAIIKLLSDVFANRNSCKVLQYNYCTCSCTSMYANHFSTNIACVNSYRSMARVVSCITCLLTQEHVFSSDNGDSPSAYYGNVDQKQLASFRSTEVTASNKLKPDYAGELVLKYHCKQVYFWNELSSTRHLPFADVLLVSIFSPEVFYSFSM